MSEKVHNRYRQLFEIKLLHHYWLDDGKKLFDFSNQQEKRLQSYDCRRFLAVTPTAGTAKIMSGLGCVYKMTALGCFAAVPDKVAVPAETMFEFAVTVRDADFFNYTALTLRSQKIYEFYHEKEKRTCRYKENISVLSNESGTMRTIRESIGLAGKETLFLSQEFPDSPDGFESFFIENDQLKQMISDKSGDVQELGAKAGNPVYLHQEDVPVITPPPNLLEEEKEKWKNVPKRGWLLSDGISDDVFVLIRLQARPNRLDNKNEEFSLVDAEEQAKEDHPVFHVCFKNRSTFWRYIDRKKKQGENQEDSTAALPLTYFGNAGTKQKPSKEQFVKIKKGNDNKIAKLISEIFI